jgi:nitroimidazol reductase NimA-like FMN-containing flavoprotein (pyridoxamine 5'-phosphate oxidase superfamily)
MMRRKDKEINDMLAIESILSEADICRIAMCDGSQPYIVPLNFGYENGILYFHSAKEGRKIDILRHNSKICFEVDIKTELVRHETICDWGMKYYSVIGEGQAEILTDIEEKKRGLDIIARKYAKDIEFEYPESMLNNIHVLKVAISQMVGKKSGY